MTITTSFSGPSTGVPLPSAHGAESLPDDPKNSQNDAINPESGPDETTTSLNHPANTWPNSKAPTPDSLSIPNSHKGTISTPSTSPLHPNNSTTPTPSVVPAHTSNTSNSATTIAATAPPSKASKNFKTRLGIGLGVAIFTILAILVCILLRLRRRRRRKSSSKSKKSASGSTQLHRRVSLSTPGGGGGGGSDSESENDPWMTTTPRDVISVVSSLSSEEDNAGSGGDAHEDSTGRARRDSDVSVLSGIVMDDGGGAGRDLGREGRYSWENFRV